MKTSELKDLALDWAVATCEGVEIILAQENWDWYSSSWEHGGPIIERERLEVRPYDGNNWIATDNLTNHTVGKTPLIAAMRCYVASKLGDDIEIPEELK